MSPSVRVRPGFRLLLAVAVAALSGCAFERRDGEKALEEHFATNAKNVQDLKCGGTVWLGYDYWLTFSVKVPMMVKDPDTYRKIEAREAQDMVRDVPGGDRFFGKGSEPFCVMRTDSSTTDLNGTIVVWDKERQHYLLRSWKHR